MPSLVEMQYNPYIPQLQILIDNMPPTDFSRLIQYSDEDIWQWIHEIMDAIYYEVRDDYFICFTGTLQDAHIVKFVCENSEHCVGFRHRDFIIKDNLPKRMAKLNQLIKRTGTTNYERTVINASFLVSSSFDEYLEDIASLDIKNLFCDVRVEIPGRNGLHSNSESDVLFILADSINDVERQVQRQNDDKPVFVLIIGNETKIIKVDKYGLFIQISADEVFDAIFDCFIQIPLIIAFRKCIQSIKGGNKITKELNLITCIEPLINIIVEKEVEMGRSIRIKTLLEPPIGETPKLTFNMINKNVASCDGLSIYGLKEGTSIFEVYKIGSKQPFFTKEIEVYSRNRITSIVLSEESLYMGLNDKRSIKLNYYPIDADNVKSISWTSSDENIATVDKFGNVEAVGVGNCRFICTAENVSAQCRCSVKPYLSDFEVDLTFDKNGNIPMEQLEEISLSIKCIPEDSIDGDIIVKSENLNIVNVIDKTLYAKNTGTTKITLENSSGKISRSFNVTVRKKKKGFFKSLFK